LFHLRTLLFSAKNLGIGFVSHSVHNRVAAVPAAVIGFVFSITLVFGPKMGTIGFVGARAVSVAPPHRCVPRSRKRPAHGSEIVGPDAWWIEDHRVSSSLVLCISY
jgi:hypothetical protein